MDTPVTLRQLRYFVATAETGKIQLAAEKVHMSPSAVAEAVKNLEDILQAKLFDRHRSGVSLTYDGHRFLDNARSILRRANDSIFSFQNKTQNIEGKLRIGASVTVLSYLLAGPLNQFERIYPGIDIELIEDSRVHLEKQLEDQNIDLAFIITSNLSSQRGLKVQSLFRSERTLWCSENHRFSAFSSVSIKEIEKERIILLTLDEAEQNVIQIWRRYGCKPNIKLRTESVEAIRNFVAREHGVALLSDLLYRPWSVDGTRILSRPVEEPIPSMNLGIVWQDRHQYIALTCFINFLKQELLRKSHPLHLA
ncbi:MAG TPA: LysR family transcriptional regulator [Oceanospirillaceae bacterium]|nr:LysR family transcriptional regulator [Oceanospirillaceae bacterium]